MRKYLFPATVTFATAFLACLFPSISSAQSTKSTYYWVSHGSPTDPVWTLFLEGAKQWAKDTGNEVRTSFHSGASGIPPGFDIIVGTLYEKDKAPFFLKVMQGGKSK